MADLESSQAHQIIRFAALRQSKPPLRQDLALSSEISIISPMTMPVKSERAGWSGQAIRTVGTSSAAQPRSKSVLDIWRVGGNVVLTGTFV